MWQVIDEIGEVVAEFKSYQAAKNWMMKRPFATHRIRRKERPQ